MQTLNAAPVGDLNERRPAAGNTERNSSHQSSRSAPPLTTRQLETLRAVEQWIDARGWPPSVDELARDVGVAKSTADEHLSALERKGYLRRGVREHRGLHVLIASAVATVVAPKPVAKATFCDRCSCERCRRAAMVGGRR